MSSEGGKDAWDLHIGGGLAASPQAWRESAVQETWKLKSVTEGAWHGEAFGGRMGERSKGPICWRSDLLIEMTC